MAWLQEIAAKHQVHPNQVSTWKRQAVEGMADVFSRGGKPEGPTEAEVKELHAKIGTLAVENDFLSEGALLHKSCPERNSPFPGQTYPTGSVTGMPRAV